MDGLLRPGMELRRRGGAVGWYWEPIEEAWRRRNPSVPVIASSGRERLARNMNDPGSS